MSEILVEVKNLKQYFPVRTGLLSSKPLKAVDDVSFTIGRGETLGLVGESGCGKTTVGRTILRLYEPTAGEVIFDGEPVTAKNITHMRKQMQMVFQDPYSSLDPRMTVEDIIGEPLDVHKLYTNRKERREKILDLMATVGLNAEHATRYAHEFSGGQRQRIGIARALAVNPKSCRKSSAWRICSSRMTFSSCVTSPSASQSCISARSSRLPMQTS